VGIGAAFGRFEWLEEVTTAAEADIQLLTERPSMIPCRSQ